MTATIYHSFNTPDTPYRVKYHGVLVHTHLPITLLVEILKENGFTPVIAPSTLEFFHSLGLTFDAECEMQIL